MVDHTVIEARFVILLIPPDTAQVLSVHDDIESLLGYQPEDFISGNVSLKDLIHSDDQDIADRLFEPDLTHDSNVFNIRLRRANGQIRVARGEFSKQTSDSGTNVALDLLLQDVTSLSRSLENNVRNLNFQTLMKNTDDFIFFKDRNHTFTDVSQTLVDICDAGVESWTDLIGLTDYEVFPEEHADEYYRLEKQIFLGAEVVHEVQEFLKEDGSTGWVDNRKYPIHDNDGNIIGLFGVARDITNEKRAEQRRVQLIAELKRTNDELNNFAYVASHDLKSPLRGIDQLASWIAEDLGDTINSETLSHLRLMRSRISRMESLLDDLLTYSRVGRTDDEVSEVNTATLVENVFELVATNDKQISLNITADMPILMTPKAPLELIFRNLVGNAIKHHDKEHGTITVSARPLPNAFEFEVKDDGPGIPIESQERVFGMFQTLKPRDLVEGSGMGLALVKKAVELVGGIISVESDGKQGCCFKFSWPTTISRKNIYDN